MSKNIRWAMGIYTAIIFLLYLHDSIGTPICFDDCLGYIPLMGIPEHFFSALWSARPYPVPVLYAFFGKYTLDHAVNIVFFQSVVSVAAWLAFALAIAQKGTSLTQRISLYVLVTLMMFGRGYLHFNQYLLSDSLALSFLLLWFACILQVDCLNHWAQQGGKARKFLCMGAFAVLSSAAMITRYSNFFFMPFALLMLWMARTKENRKSVFTLAMVILVMAGAAYIPAEHRSHVNVKHILVGTILPSDDMRAFFIAHGMPDTPELEAFSHQLKKQSLIDADINDMQVNLDRMEPLLPRSFFERANKIYMLYLLQHPSYVLGNIIGYNATIFDQHAFPAGFHFGDSAALQKPCASCAPTVIPPSLDISPIDGVNIEYVYLLFVAATLLCWFRFGADMPQLFWLGTILAAAGFINAVVSFHGDLWELSEMGRHAFIGSIFFRIGMLIVMITAAAAPRSHPRNALPV